MKKLYKSDYTNSQINIRITKKNKNLSVNANGNKQQTMQLLYCIQLHFNNSTNKWYKELFKNCYVNENEL